MLGQRRTRARSAPREPAKKCRPCCGQQTDSCWSPVARSAAPPSRLNATQHNTTRLDSTRLNPTQAKARQLSKTSRRAATGCIRCARERRAGEFLGQQVANKWRPKMRAADSFSSALGHFRFLRFLFVFFASHHLTYSRGHSRCADCTGKSNDRSD